jgi:TolB-like protein
MPLTGERIERRLVAILAADVVGYSRLTGIDEEGTHVQLKEHFRVLVDPQVREHHGRIVKHTGDGILAEFASVVDSVRCAIDVQRGMGERNAHVPQEKRIEFRIGINVGDIITDGGDIFGDCVNVAVRLEQIADPGGICISSRAQEYVSGQLDISCDDVGEQKLKNIMEPVRAFCVRLEKSVRKERPRLALPDRPSIAVLPFANMSDHPEQEYFADGMVEDIITALSRIRWLFVIARNSSFTYKTRTVDIKQVGKELGVRYVLEGSVRKSLNRVRISGQLIDASTGVHLWADRFEGALSDIFDLQDQMTISVVGAIAPKLEQAEIKRKPTGSLDAYDFYLRGLASVHRSAREPTTEALRLFYRAIELDPEFASAYGAAAQCYALRKVSGWMVDPKQETAETAVLAQRAAEVGKDDAAALCWAGHALAYVVGELHYGAALIERALMLNPNLADAWSCSGWVRICLASRKLPSSALRERCA